MAFDKASTARLRKALGALEGVREQRMFGGICFMLNGHMVAGADQARDGTGRFMFRVGKDFAVEAEVFPGAVAVAMGGRTLRGFFYVAEAGCDNVNLGRWLDLVLRFVRSLPPKGEP